MRSPMQRRALLPPHPILIPTCAANVSPQVLASGIAILCTLLVLLSLVESQTKTDLKKNKNHLVAEPTSLSTWSDVTPAF